MSKELQDRRNEFPDTEFKTIYFGGGTPSVLSIKEITSLFELIYRCFPIQSHPEITFEANPDDLTQIYLSDIVRYTPVNRLSIGIQSFHNSDLTLLNRRHTGKEAFESIERSMEAGFKNLNIDLIYGIPGMTLPLWEENLKIFNSFDIPHLSAYHLTFEPKTVFSHYMKKGRLSPVTEETSLNQFELLLDFAEHSGYDHYEISNFSKKGYYSKHNTAYWKGDFYLGIGPSAHSYRGHERRWNVSENTRYCHMVEQNSTEYFEKEQIQKNTSFNEYILISLRTRWGIELPIILSRFGKSYYVYFKKVSNKFLLDGTLSLEDDRISLTRKGMFIADYIISELMKVDDKH